MEEIWKDIEGYEGYYQVSNIGRIRSLDRCVSTTVGKRLLKGKICKQTHQIRHERDGTGYYFVALSKNNITKSYRVHRLVAKAFIPNPNNLPFVNHKDEDKTNNNVDNLEWCTLEYNNNYGTARERANTKKRMSVLKFDLQGNLLKRYDGLGLAAEEEGVSRGNLENVCVHRNNKKTLNNFIFMYENDYNENGFIGYKNYKIKAVNQYDLNGRYIRTFDSIKQAGETIPNLCNNGEANITAVCRNRQRYAYGYIWRYAEDTNGTDDIVVES